MMNSEQREGRRPRVTLADLEEEKTKLFPELLATKVDKKRQPRSIAKRSVRRSGGENRRGR